jgi:hypothetical protein
MALLFHQNMRVYGGNSVARNQTFDTAFAAIQASTGADYVVAGFTEIDNNEGGQQFAVRALSLDQGLTSWVLIEVGITAIGGRAEYLGIAWDPNYVTAQHAGVVVYNAVARRWECHNQQGTPPPPLIVLPDFRIMAGKRRHESNDADSRGLAYIAGTAFGANCIFAFMHNMLNLGERTMAFSVLNDMRTAVDQAVGFAASEAYVGGDFNLRPRDPRNGGLLEHAAARNLANTRYLNTTNSNPYDFWLTDQGLTNADAAVRYPTLNQGASDHAGITLRL